MKLRGRAEAPAIDAEGAQFPSARGDNPEAHHGPLQRLLEDAPIEATVRARQQRCKERRHRGGLTTGLPIARARDCFKRRIFGSGFQLFMTLKMSLGCGL